MLICYCLYITVFYAEFYLFPLQLHVGKMWFSYEDWFSTNVHLYRKIKKINIIQLYLKWVIELKKQLLLMSARIFFLIKVIIGFVFLMTLWKRNVSVYLILLGSCIKSSFINMQCQQSICVYIKIAVHSKEKYMPRFWNISKSAAKPNIQVYWTIVWTYTLISF